MSECGNCGHEPGDWRRGYDAGKAKVEAELDTARRVSLEVMRERDEARAELAELRKDNEGIMDAYKGVEADMIALHDENARLRASIAPVVAMLDHAALVNAAKHSPAFAAALYGLRADTRAEAPAAEGEGTCG